jgi:WD40 repeat protein
VSVGGRHIVSSSHDKTLKVWDIEKRSVIATFCTDGEFNAVTMAPDGVNIVAGDNFGSVHFLRLENCQQDPSYRKRHSCF